MADFSRSRKSTNFVDLRPPKGTKFKTTSEYQQQLARVDQAEFMQKTQRMYKTLANTAPTAKLRSQSRMDYDRLRGGPSRGRTFGKRK